MTKSRNIFDVFFSFPTTTLLGNPLDSLFKIYSDSTSSLHLYYYHVDPSHYYLLPELLKKTLPLLPLYDLFLTAASDTFKTYCATASHNLAMSPHFTQSENRSPSNSSQDLKGSLPFPSPALHAIISPDLLYWFSPSAPFTLPMLVLHKAGSAWHKPSRHLF